MIKLVAAITMIIDHVGYILLPGDPMYPIFRMIGRLSMPLFAYCIARGYAYSLERGTLKKYLKNLILFTILSQIPYSLTTDGLNIGATWTLSLLLFIILEERKSDALKTFVRAGIVLLAAYMWKTDYGVYGVLMPVTMYIGIIKHKNFTFTFTLVTALWAFYVTILQGSFIQVFSIFAVPVLYAVQPIDHKIKLPKYFYYAFYPAHIIVLLAIKYLFM